MLASLQKLLKHCKQSGNGTRALTYEMLRDSMVGHHDLLIPTLIQSSVQQQGKLLADSE